MDDIYTVYVKKLIKETIMNKEKYFPHRSNYYDAQLIILSKMLKKYKSRSHDEISIRN